MPAVDNYEYQHPWATPEPHFLPGYTGYLPSYGPKRIYQMADTYGHMTHNIMANHSTAGLRLGHILDDEEGRLKAQQEDYLVNSRRFYNQDVRLRGDIVPGYTGYIPRSSFLIGKTYTPGSKEAIAEFETYQIANKRHIQAPILPPNDVMPPYRPIPEIRPHGNYRPGSECKWGGFPNYGQYHRSPQDMSELTPHKRYPPRFSGAHGGDPPGFIPGARCKTGPNQDLCDMTNYCIDRRIRAKTHSTHNWYRQDGIYPTGQYPPDVRCQAPQRRQQPQPGYTGFVPGYLSAYGTNSGSIAQNFLRDQEMKFVSGLRGKCH